MVEVVERIVVMDSDHNSREKEQPVRGEREWVDVARRHLGMYAWRDSLT